MILSYIASLFKCISIYLKNRCIMIKREGEKKKTPSLIITESAEHKKNENKYLKINLIARR